MTTFCFKITLFCPVCGNKNPISAPLAIGTKLVCRCCHTVSTVVGLDPVILKADSMNDENDLVRKHS